VWNPSESTCRGVCIQLDVGFVMAGAMRDIDGEIEMSGRFKGGEEWADGLARLDGSSAVNLLGAGSNCIFSVGVST
jgi:hypothetical protein